LTKLLGYVDLFKNIAYNSITTLKENSNQNRHFRDLVAGVNKDVLLMNTLWSF